MKEELNLSKEDFNGKAHLLDFQSGKVVVFSEKEEQDFNSSLDRLLINTGVK